MLIIDQAKNEAIKILKKCENKKGFFASGGEEGYQAVWARDLSISMLGGSLIGNEFRETFKKSLETLEKNQSKLGQIPNCVGDYNPDRQSDVTYTTIDSSLWFIIGEHLYAKAYKDKKLFKKHKKAINKALVWVKYQDTGEDYLPEQQPTSDWQDAFPHKYGHAINTQALYYEVLKLSGKKGEAKIVKKMVNGQGRKDLTIFSKKLNYYRPWIWKNHDGDREQGGWFDSLGNMLAIIFELAPKERAAKILDYIEKEGINEPYPLKAIFPPMEKGDQNWHSYFEKCDAREPFNYLNAGIWPYLGGFYVAALVKAKRLGEANRELETLAEANQLKTLGKWGFCEWLDGITGAATDNNFQAWSAGMYIYAYECVRRKKVMWF